MSKTGRYYSFRFSDESFKLFRRLWEAEMYAASKGLTIKYDPIKFIEDNRPTARNDSFVAGYQPHLGKFITTKREYNRVIKEKGIIEVGTERVPTTKRERKGLDRSDLKELSKEGVSDRAIDSIKDD